MHVFGHNHIASDVIAVPKPNSFEFVFKDLACGWGVQKFSSLIAAKGDEMQTALLLIAFGFGRHRESVCPPCPFEKAEATRVGQPQFQIRKGWASPPESPYVFIGPTLANAGFYPAFPVPIPANTTATAWPFLTNTTGLIAGVTRLGDELSLLYRQDQIAASVFASMLNWTWNGTSFASD